jgi:hypothetical protein
MLKRSTRWRLLVLGVLLCGLPGCPITPVNLWDAFRIDSSPSFLPVTVAVADIDADGDVDIVSAWQGEEASDGTGTDAAIVVHFQQGSSWVDVIIDAGTVYRQVNAVAVADVDQDDQLDVVAATNDRIIYLNAPDDPTDAAGWTPYEIAASIGDDFLAWFDVAIGQIDGDNGPDIVAALNDDGRLLWFAAPADPNQADNWELFTIDSTSRALADSVLLFDLSGDDRLDVISTAAGESSDSVSWYVNPTDPTNDDWTKRPISNLSGATRMALGDVNNDDRADLLVISPEVRRVAWLQQPSNVNNRWSGWFFADYQDSDDDRTPVDIEVADLNNDGQNEAIVATNNNAGIRSYTPGEDNRLLWNETPLQTFDMSTVVLVDSADVNGDGNVDVVLPVTDDNDASRDRVTWLRNPGPE